MPFPLQRLITRTPRSVERDTVMLQLEDGRDLEVQRVRDPRAKRLKLSVDERGAFAIPLLSGHVGGANELARLVARACGGRAAISTATDVNGLFAVDEWAARNGLAIIERDVAKEVSAALLEGCPVGFRSDFGLFFIGQRFGGKFHPQGYPP